MKKIKIAVAAFILSLSLTSCTGNGPEGVTKEFVSLTSRGEFTEAKELCTEPTAQLLTMAEGFLGEKKAEMKEKNKDVSIEIISSKVENDSATVKYKVKPAPDSAGTEKDIDLIKVDGKWKVNINKEGMPGAK